jgi:hypothetical protein
MTANSPSPSDAAKCTADYVDELTPLDVSMLYVGGQAREAPLQRDFRSAGGTIAVVKLEPRTEEVLCTVTREAPRKYMASTKRSLVTVVYALPYFGGKRALLVCPMCNARVGKLYLHGSAFLCRVCGGLRHRSKYDPDGARIVKIKRLRRELGPPVGRNRVPSRPKGMHHQTYERRLQELADLEGRT